MARPRGACSCVYRRQPRARDRIWFSIRALRRFDLPALAATAEASHENAAKYVRGLTRAGVLRMVVPRASGYRDGHAVWLLVRDVGPLAPRLRSCGHTYDPNSHTVLEGGLKQ